MTPNLRAAKTFQPKCGDGADEHLRILIYGVSYRPEEVGIAPYTTAIAEHFAGLGHQVVVVAAMPHYPQWRVRDGYRRRLQMREHLFGVTVYRYRNWVPTRQTAFRRLLFEVTFLLNAARFKPDPTTDVIIGVTPSFSGCALAIRAALDLDVPIGVIVQDLMGRAAAQSGISGGKPLSRLFSIIEGAVFRRSDLVALVSERFAPHLLSAGVSTQRLFALPNWTHTERKGMSTLGVRDRLGWDSDHEVVLHAGTLGLKQGLEQVIVAAQLALERRPKMLFVFMGDGSERRSLEQRARHVENVRFVPIQEDDVFPSILSAADILLVSERTTNIDMSLPSKLNSYFAAARPVLAFVNPLGATAALLTASKAGLVVNSADPGALIVGASKILDSEDISTSLVASAHRYVAEVSDSVAALRRAEDFLHVLIGGERPGKCDQNFVSRLTT